MSFYRQMEVFRAVMTSDSLTAAAERLLVTQPAVSKQLQALEERIGTRLFLREGSRLRPTPAARALFAQSERAFAGMHSLDRFAMELARSTPQHVRLSVMPMISRLWLPAQLASLLQRYPDLHMTVSTAPSTQILDLLESDQIDIGIALPMRRLGSSDMRTLMSSQAVCVLPRGHRLAARPFVGPEDLAEENFLLLGPVSGTRRDILDAFARSGITPRVKVEIDLADLAVSLVAAGQGVAIIDNLTAQAHVQMGLAIEIRRFRPAVTIEIAIFLSRSTAAMPIARSVHDGLLAAAHGA